MNQYTITKVSGKPDWEKIPPLKVDNYQWLPPVDIRMEAQLCYDETGIHVHLRAWEKNIRAEHTQPLSEVCEDSCMEFFVRPVEDDLRYFNIEINPNGCSYIGFGPDLPNLVRLAPENEDALLNKTVRYTEDGWEVFYTVPVAMIRVFFPGYTLTPGRRFYANCYKCGDLTETPHYISWNKIETERPSFHQPKCFGVMILREE